jgi:hypothetical protein
LLPTIETLEKNKILQQLLRDYNIPSAEIDAVVKWEKTFAGHLTREILFRKMLESYSWSNILQLFTPEEVKILLTSGTVTKLRTLSFRLNYEFVRKRLHDIRPIAG